VERIESLFTQLDAGVAGLKRAQAALKRYRASVLKAACEGMLIGSEEIGDNPVSDGLPKEWLSATIEDVSTHIVDCLHSTPKFIDSGKYCIDTNCIEPAKIIFDKARFVSENTFLERIRRLEPKPDDILFSREGTIGIAVLIPENIELCLGQRMMQFRASDKMLPRFLMWSLLSPTFEKQWKPKIIGTTSPHINIRDIRKMFIPLPPLCEQKCIVEEIERRLSVVEELEQAVSANLKMAARLQQAILKRAFEGRLV
jgi:type I restriction enzyme S subunit